MDAKKKLFASAPAILGSNSAKKSKSRKSIRKSEIQEKQPEETESLFANDMDVQTSIMNNYTSTNNMEKDDSEEDGEKLRPPRVSFAAHNEQLSISTTNPSSATVSKNASKTGSEITTKKSVQKSDFEMLVELMPGHTVDINRLVFQPRPKVEIKLSQEKLTTYLPDYIFIMVNFLTLMLCTYYILVGLTVYSFQASITSINRDNIEATVLHLGFGFRIPPIITEEEFRASTMGFMTLGGALIQIINVIVGIYGCVQGYRNILYTHITIDALFMIAQLVIGALATGSSSCKENDLLITQNKLIEYVQLYGTKGKATFPTDEPTLASDKERWYFATYQLDSIQRGLACCGVLSWSDYLFPELLMDTTHRKTDDFLHNSFKTQKLTEIPRKYELDGTTMVLPASCCRQWWTRNVNCAAGVHRWANPTVDNATARKFRMRINQVGCMWRIKEGCNRIRGLASNGMLYIGILDIFLIIIQLLCIFVIVKRIYVIIGIKKQANEKEEKEYSGDGKRIIESTIPLPTEDEIELIKARTDFNKFESRVRRTQIGLWMQQARKSVYNPLSHVDESVSKSVKEEPMSESSMRRKTLAESAVVESSTSHLILKLPSGQDVLESLTDDIDPHHLEDEELLKREIQKQKDRHNRRRSIVHNVNPSTPNKQILANESGADARNANKKGGKNH